jgi:hypothetical protein
MSFALAARLRVAVKIESFKRTSSHALCLALTVRTTLERPTAP